MSPISQTIDLFPFVSNGKVEEKRFCARSLLGVAHRDGYAVVKGTGIDEKAQADVLSLARSALRTQNGGAVPLRPPGYRGRQELGENVTQGLRDQHAALDFMQVLSQDEVVGMSSHVAAMATASNGYLGGDVQRVVETYVRQVVRAGQAVMSAVGMALGVDCSVFNAAFDNPFWLVRLIRYPGVGDGDSDSAGLGCGAHRDYGFLTFVTEFEVGAEVSALQVSRTGMDEDFEHVCVPPPGCFVLNFGDCLEALTGGAFPSTLHRVVRPRTERVSVAVFVEPNIKWKIQSFPLPQSGWWREDRRNETDKAFVERLGRIAKYETYGEYLYSKVSTNHDLYETEDT